MVTKGDPTSVILRGYVATLYNWRQYNADLGNGADGWQATASNSPHFLLQMARLGPSQPSAGAMHRNKRDPMRGGFGGEPVEILAFSKIPPRFSFTALVPVVRANRDSVSSHGFMELQ